MQRIESFEQYKTLIQKAKTIDGVVTNCYLLPMTVKNMISSKTLYVLEKENLLLLLEKEDGFFRVNYYLSACDHYDKVSLNLPAVIEFVFQGELTEPQKNELQRLEELGFCLGRESGRMGLSPEALHPGCACSVVAVAGEADVDAALKLITEYFNPLYAYIPPREELLRAIRRGEVFAVYQDGKLAGVLYSEMSKKTASIRQLVVSQEFRSRGYAKQLVEAYHQKYCNQVALFSHWVDRNNTAAIQLYASFGYSFDGRRANEYIL